MTRMRRSGSHAPAGGCSVDIECTSAGADAVHQSCVGFDREVRVDLHQNCHASRRYVDVELLVEEAECAEAAGIEFGVAALPVQHMVEQASKLVRAGAKAPSPCSGHHRCRRRG